MFVVFSQPNHHFSKNENQSFCYCPEADTLLEKSYHRNPRIGLFPWRGRPYQKNACYSGQLNCKACS